MSERPIADRFAGPMPLHNLLVHVVGYADRGCAGCDWLRARGFIPALAPRPSAPAGQEGE